MKEIITLFPDDIIERFRNLPLNEIELTHIKNLTYDKLVKVEIVRIMSNDLRECYILKDNYSTYKTKFVRKVKGLINEQNY